MNLHANFGLRDLGDTKRVRQTDRRTWLYRLGCWRWSRIYILYGVCHASFCLLRTFFLHKR